MRLLIMGAPGAGKGTQAVYIKNAYSIPHISTGDMFRNAISEKTPIGVLAKSYIDKGMLVPDSVTIELVKERISKEDCINGFILDGYPRTTVQAESLDNLLNELGIRLDACLYIDVSNEVLIDRIVGRLVCPKCGASYHITNAMPKLEGICDYCNSKLIHREDDNEATVKTRIDVYQKSTAPLLDYYNNQNLLLRIDGAMQIEEIFASIKEELKNVQ